MEKIEISSNVGQWSEINPSSIDMDQILNHTPQLYHI